MIQKALMELERSQQGSSTDADSHIYVSRADFVISKEKNILIGLNLIAKNLDRSYAELEKVARKEKILKGGMFFNVLTDIKTMLLAKNGGKIGLTDPGTEILAEPTNRNLWKTAYATVPLYKLIIQQEKFKGDISYGAVVKWAFDNCDFNTNPRVFAMGLRRVLTGYYDIDLPKRLKYPTEKRGHKKQVIENLFNKNMPIMISALTDIRNDFIHDSAERTAGMRDAIEILAIFRKLKGKYNKAEIDKLWEIA